MINAYGTYLSATTPVLGSSGSEILSSYISSELLSSEKEKLRDEISVQRKKVSDLAKDLNKKELDIKEKDRLISELTENVSKLNYKEKLNFLLVRVNAEAQKLLFENEDFRLQFENGSPNNVVVMAIDIRRSTELMLKAKSAEAFSGFITTLCTRLSEIIKKYYGVFDKFTGDGILAFFPEFYSGENAILLALSAAEECHKFFNQHYRDSRNCFNSVLLDIGLGIGVDCGQAHLVNISGGLTVVGTPVVYACRMSGAKAGDTLLNQPAYEAAYPKYAEYYKFESAKLEIKHEGSVLAYKATSNMDNAKINKPDWTKWEKPVDAPSEGGSQ